MYMFVPWNQSAIMMMLYTRRYCHWKARKSFSLSPLGRTLDSEPSALSEFLVAKATHEVTPARTAKVRKAQAGQSGSAIMAEASDRPGLYGPSRLTAKCRPPPGAKVP